MFEVKTESTITKAYETATKQNNSREAAQLRAINFIRSMGGIAWFVATANHVHFVYEEFIKGLKK